MENTGREHGRELDQQQGNPPDEAATPSGWVITKEASEPAEIPARAKTGGGSKGKDAAKKTKPAAARKKAPAARRAAGGKKKASAKPAQKTKKTARTAGRRKAAPKSGKRKVR